MVERLEDEIRGAFDLDTGDQVMLVGEPVSVDTDAFAAAFFCSNGREDWVVAFLGEYPNGAHISADRIEYEAVQTAGKGDFWGGVTEIMKGYIKRWRDDPQSRHSTDYEIGSL